jgi:hypothetical protein
LGVIGRVPALPRRKRSAGFIFVLDHEAPGYDIDNVALIAPMVCLKAGTVDDETQRDVTKVASSGCGSARLSGLNNGGDSQPVDHADWDIFDSHDVTCEAMPQFKSMLVRGNSIPFPATQDKEDNGLLNRNAFAALQEMCRFLDAGNDSSASHSGGRRPKKRQGTKSRAVWHPAGRAAMGI